MPYSNTTCREIDKWRAKNGIWTVRRSARIFVGFTLNDNDPGIGVPGVDQATLRIYGAAQPQHPYGQPTKHR